MKLFGWHVPFTAVVEMPLSASPPLSPVADPAGIQLDPKPDAPAYDHVAWSPGFPESIPSPNSTRLTRPVVSEWTQIYSKVTPEQLLGWMLAQQQGNFYAGYMITSRMEATWPKFRKNFHELREAVSRCKYVVSPYSDEGEQPTESAKEKARLFSRCLRNFSPNPVSDERGFHETIYDLCSATISGVSAQEILWRDTTETESGMYEPRATAWVFTPHQSFLPDGTLGVGSYEQYQHWAPGSAKPIDKDRFLVAVYQTRSGPASTFGLAQPLMWWWMAVRYAQDWMYKYAQIFGSPLRWATYKQGASKATIDKIEQALRDMGFAGYGAFPEGSNIQLVKDSGSAANNPQDRLMELADTYCDLMVLGQTLSSNSNAATGGGSRALGQVHENTKQERILGVAAWICDGPLNQLARAWSRVNYGNENEIPTIKVDTTRPEDPLAMAQRDQVLLSIPGFVMPRQWLHDRHGIPLPKQGDEIVEGTQATPSGAAGGTNKPGEQPTNRNAAPELEADTTIQTREFLTAAMGNGDKHNRVYEFINGKGTFRSVPMTAATSRSKVQVQQDDVVAAAVLEKFTAAQGKAMGPVTARLKALQELPDDQFIDGAKAILKDFPSLTKQVLQSKHGKVVADELADAMKQAAGVK